MPFGNPAYAADYGQFGNMGMNPMYYTMPVTPPGLAGIPYMLSDILAPLFGGVARPYVPINMGTYDAQVAKSITLPYYKEFAAKGHGMLFEQMANTVGAMPFIDTIANKTGYDALQLRRDMSSGARALGSGFLGQFIAPVADSLLSGAGLSGGSFIGAMNEIYNSRMNLMSPGTYFNPTDATMMERGMGTASAMLELFGGLFNERDSKTGKTKITPNLAMTQGLDTQYLASMIVKAAGAGLFRSNVEGGFSGKDVRYKGNLEDQLRQAADGYDIAELSFDDLSGEGPDRVVDKKTAERLKESTRRYTESIKGVAEALGAMRDLTNSVEDLDKKLDDLTNGDWKRSTDGLYRARDAATKLKAVSQVYNIDPNAAISQIQANRGILQSAAGFDPYMQRIGFNGGGMFGFNAQIDVLSAIEDKITRSGVRGDPVLEARMRYQGVNSLARSMNTSAGRASQLLAYAMQTGVLDEEQGNRFRDGLMSGDRGAMGESLNKMLVTLFGSEETGRKMMNNANYMQAIRMGLDDRYGAYANRMMIGGADAEMLDREKHTAVAQRLNYANTSLRQAGLNTRQTEYGVDRIVDAVVDDFDTPELKQYGEMFREQVETFKKKGMTPDAALNAAVNAFKKSPATARFASKIDLAVKRQTAENNENTFTGEEYGGESRRQLLDVLDAMRKDDVIDADKSDAIRKIARENGTGTALLMVDEFVGTLDTMRQEKYRNVMKDSAEKYRDRQGSALEGMKALSAVNDMSTSRVIDGAKAGEVRKLVREGKGKEAMAIVTDVMSGLTDTQRARLNETIEATTKKYEASRDAIDENKQAEKMIIAAQSQNYGSEAISESINIANAAALQYMKDVKDPKRAEGAYDRFWGAFSKSKLGEIYDDDVQQEYLDAVQRGDEKYIKKMGRMSFRLKQMAVETRGQNGWDLSYTGFFNSGLYAGNSEIAAKERDELVNSIAANMTDDALRSTEDRNSFAQDLVGFLTGEKDFKNVLKIYDKDDKLGSRLKQYVEKNDTFLEKQNEYRESKKDYLKNMRKLRDGGFGDNVARIEGILKDNPELTDRNIEDIYKQLDGAEDIIGSEGVEAIKKILTAKKEMGAAQKEAKESIKVAAKDEDIAKYYKEMRARQSLDTKRVEREKAKYPEVFSFMDSLDIDEKTLDSAKGKMKAAQDAMYSLVKEEDVAKYMKLDSSKGLSKRDYTQVAMEITKERAASGDKDAMEVVRKYSAAKKEQDNRLTGKLTIVNGNEQADAVLEASVGGGF